MESRVSIIKCNLMSFYNRIRPRKFFELYILLNVCNLVDYIVNITFVHIRHPDALTLHIIGRTILIIVYCAVKRNSPTIYSDKLEFLLIT